MPDVSLAALALRLAISMGVVVGLMLLAAKLLRRAQTAAAGSAAKRGGRSAVTRTPIDVTTLSPLTRNASIAIVRAAGRELVVGVTETHVTLLHSGIEPRALDLDTQRTFDGQDARDELSATSSVAHVDAARTAASIPDLGGSPEGQGQSAWTDALETLRARTARR